MTTFIAVIHLDQSHFDPAVFAPMMERIEYRGPDGQFTHFDENAAFGVSLFRTVNDTLPEQQPLTIGDVTIVGNVRIDARADLIRALQARDPDAALVLPDIELVLRAYLLWGEDCLNKLLGDFAFVIYDKPQQRVFIVRDHLGIQPVYYACLDHKIIVSNELMAIRLHPSVSDTLDDTAVGDFLLFGSTRNIDKTLTVFADVRRLAPAHKLTINRNDDAPLVQRYWTLPANESLIRYKTEAEYIEHFTTLLKTAMKDRLRTERAVISLSGGLDSSTLAAIICMLRDAGELDVDLTAMTIVYDRVHPDTEAFYASLVTQKLAIKHQFFVADSYRIAPPLPAAPEPAEGYTNGFAEDGNEFQSEFGRVALSGEPADALLSYERLIDRLRRMPLKEAVGLYAYLWRVLDRHPPLSLSAYLRLRTWRSPRFNTGYGYPQWLNPEFERQANLRHRKAEFDVNNRPVEHRLHHLAHMSLGYPDWSMHMEMLEPLSCPPPEYVLPFADLRIVQYFLRLPPEPWFTRKYLMRQAMANHLPELVLQRRKTPLGTFLSSLLAQPETQWVNTWKATPQLEKYVVRGAIPTIPLDGRSPGEAYLNIRPLLFNSWLEQALGL